MAGKKKREIYKWTDEQVKFLLDKPPNYTWVDFAKIMNKTFNVNRNTGSVYAKYKKEKMLRNLASEKDEAQEGIKEPISEPDEPRFSRTRKRWTPQEELEVLVNFYSLSVDEARERWQRPYRAIAGRLESICDMTEPHHESLLMEAAKIVKQKEAMKRKPTRKERKLAKRAAKIAKKQDRLAKKIQHLERGMKNDR